MKKTYTSRPNSMALIRIFQCLRQLNMNIKMATKYQAWVFVASTVTDQQVPFMFTVTAFDFLRAVIL